MVSLVAGRRGWLWAVGLGTLVYCFSLGEADLTVTTYIWQFPLIAFGMSLLLICPVSPRVPLQRFALPGAAFVANIV